ncbi:MAG: hypothetical protein NTY57_05925 [Solirubrobacterales bacterium]|nr:hypothetical protein [Solirubrobacterales bacterium]
MADPAPRPREARPRQVPARPKRIGPKPVFAAGVVTFVTFTSLLGFQVAAGKDPSLGHGWQKRKVVHHKVKKIIVTRVYDAPVPDSYGGYSSDYSSSGSSSSNSYGGSGGSSSYSSPAPTYSAPTYSAPTVSSGSSGG